MRLIQAIPLLFLAGTELASAAVLIVPPGDEGNMFLDPDQDGVAEAYALSTDSFGAFFARHGEGVAGASLGPGVSFAGNEYLQFASVSAMLASSVASVTYTAPPSLDRVADDVVGFGTTTLDQPVILMWLHGTSGSDGDPVHFLGIAADFTDHFASGGAEPALFYYHDYGAFLAGQSSGPISITATGIPEPSSVALLGLAVVAGFLRFRRRQAAR